uniref:Uncharacterized protein n=1 Tax=Rhizophora mucronata TaxID=61149 RepID=A0A2P2NAX1_RHIMU
MICRTVIIPSSYLSDTSLSSSMSFLYSSFDTFLYCYINI